METKAFVAKAMSQQMADWVGPPTDPTKKKRASIWNRDAAQQEVTAFIAAQDWATARPRHLVELYARLHTEVYGVEPLDLKKKPALMAAASLASKATKEHFDGSFDDIVSFVRWVWVRQALDEKKRRAGTMTNDFRISWRYQWSPRLITDYRRAMLTRVPK